MAKASPALGANEAVLILMPSLQSQSPHLLTQDLSQRPQSPQGRKSHLCSGTLWLLSSFSCCVTPPSPHPLCCPLAVSVSPGPHIALFPRGPGACAAYSVVSHHLGPCASPRLLKHALSIDVHP